MYGLGFDNMIFTLQQWGVIDVILPFILIFTIVFAVMEKTKILGSEDYQVRKYAAIISMVVAFAVVVPHITGAYYYGFDAVQVINNALPQVGLLLVAIVMMLLTIGLWTGKRADGSKGIGTWFTMASVVVVIGIFIASMGWWQVPQWLWFSLNSELIALVVAILVFGIIINFIAQGEKKPDKDKKPLSKDIQEFLQG
ncbi:MAG: hypothetical protein KC535_00455 [Nanoarchaeota archaeon]|nr:hypothetical protein [Nanoarchaeota archaeon]